MDLVKEQVSSIKSLLRSPRTSFFSCLNLSMIVFSALMMWLGCVVATNSDSPIVVVLSGSMEPAVKRGDILFLNNNQRDLHVGDIVVFKISGEFAGRIREQPCRMVAFRSSLSAPLPRSSFVFPHRCNRTRDSDRPSCSGASRAPHPSGIVEGCHGNIGFQSFFLCVLFSSY